MSTTTSSLDATAAGAVHEFQPIAAYGLLADCNSAALVDRDGSIAQLGLPLRVDPGCEPDPRGPVHRGML